MRRPYREPGDESPGLYGGANPKSKISINDRAGFGLSGAGEIFLVGDRLYNGGVNFGRLNVAEDRLHKLEALLEKQPKDTFLLYALALECKKAGDLGRAWSGWNGCWSWTGGIVTLITRRD